MICIVVASGHAQFGDDVLSMVTWVVGRVGFLRFEVSFEVKEGLIGDGGAVASQCA